MFRTRRGLLGENPDRRRGGAEIVGAALRNSNPHDAPADDARMGSRSAAVTFIAYGNPKVLRYAPAYDPLAETREIVETLTSRCGLLDRTVLAQIAAA